MNIEFVDFNDEYQIGLSGENEMEIDALNSLSDKENMLEIVQLMASTPPRIILRIKRNKQNNE